MSSQYKYAKGIEKLIVTKEYLSTMLAKKPKPKTAFTFFAENYLPIFTSLCIYNLKLYTCQRKAFIIMKYKKNPININQAYTVNNRQQ